MLLHSLPSLNVLPSLDSKAQPCSGTQLHSSGLNCADSSDLVKTCLLSTFQTALGFNPGTIAHFKTSPAPFILQEIARFSTQPYIEE